MTSLRGLPRAIHRLVKRLGMYHVRVVKVTPCVPIADCGGFLPPGRVIVSELKDPNTGKCSRWENGVLVRQWEEDMAPPTGRRHPWKSRQWMEERV